MCPPPTVPPPSPIEGVDAYHREIWSDARSGRLNATPPVFYVENHNASIGYSEAALDFEMLVVDLLPRLGPRELGNWTGPVLHLARQTIELRLKALLQEVLDRDQAVDDRLLGKHDLSALWNVAHDWLQNQGYGVKSDARLESTNTLIAAFHAVDPSGDLFRFAQSRQARFGKRKSYDRVGVNHQTFPSAFRQTVELLRHWEAVLFREQLKAEHGWDKDPHFEPDDYPKNTQPAAADGAA
jgi:hypothetical protein